MTVPTIEREAPEVNVPDVTQEGADLDAQGPAADLVRVYLIGIGKTALLTGEQEVGLA